VDNDKLGELYELLLYGSTSCNANIISTIWGTKLMPKCIKCNCDCHCSVEEHPDSKGICYCTSCTHEEWKDEVKYDDR